MMIVQFDGGCRKNPGGPGAAAFVVFRDGLEIHRESRHLGSGDRMTNNVAEFTAMKMILEWAQTLDGQENIKIVGDSQVVINRMRKRGRGQTSGICAEVAAECVQLLLKSKRAIFFEWHRREKNELADSLCNEILGEKAHRKPFVPRKLPDDRLPFGGRFEI